MSKTNNSITAMLANSGMNYVLIPSELMENPKFSLDTEFLVGKKVKRNAKEEQS